MENIQKILQTEILSIPLSQYLTVVVLIVAGFLGKALTIKIISRLMGLSQKTKSQTDDIVLASLFILRVFQRI